MANLFAGAIAGKASGFGGFPSIQAGAEASSIRRLMHRLFVLCILLVVIVAEGSWLLLLARGVMRLLALFLSVPASLS